MKITELLAKLTYWNCWFTNNKKMISIKSLKRKLYNPKYMFVYLSKNDQELQYLLPNTILIEYNEFILRINMLNKKQHIILLNNVHDIPEIYNNLKEQGYKVSILDWNKHKNINDVFKSVLNKK